MGGSKAAVHRFIQQASVGNVDSNAASVLFAPAQTVVRRRCGGGGVQEERGCHRSHPPHILRHSLRHPGRRGNPIEGGERVGGLLGMEKEADGRI